MASVDTISWLSMSSIMLLPFVWLLVCLIRLAFFRRAVVFCGELHDKDHPFCEARGGWMEVRCATALEFPGTCRGEARMLGDADVEIRIDNHGLGDGGRRFGRVAGSQEAEHDVFAEASPDPDGKVPATGLRDWRDLWMGARSAIPGGMWVRETGLLFRKQRRGKQISLAARASGAALLYQKDAITPEEEPLLPKRGIADLLLPSLLIFLMCYPWLAASPMAPHHLYLFYIGILVLMHVFVVVLESSQRDRVRRVLEMVNRNTGLHKWNAAIVIFGLICLLICLVAGNLSSLPFVLVSLIAVAVNWVHASSALWKVSPRALEGTSRNPPSGS